MPTMMSSIGKYTRLTLHRALSPVLRDGAQRNLAVTTSMTGLKGVGLYWGLKLVGLDPSPLLAVFGLFGAAVGFAAKDMVSNFISGATLAASNTFHKGDKITVGLGSSASTGVLIDMDMKYLYLEQEDGSLLLIPNGNVTTSVVAVAGAASRKKAETVMYSSIKDEEHAKSLTEDDQTRRGKQIVFSSFILVPFVVLATLFVLVACGFVTQEELSNRLLGKKVIVQDVQEQPQKGLVDALNQKLQTIPKSLTPLNYGAPGSPSADAVASTILNSITGDKTKKEEL